MFRPLLQVLEQHRLELNQADFFNQDHGDHMLAVFQRAVDAAQAQPEAGLADGLEAAAGLLRQLPENGSAQVYARGLEQFARQFRQRGIDLPALLAYTRSTLDKQKPVGAALAAAPLAAAPLPPSTSAEVLKALLGGLSAWEQAEKNPDKVGQANSLPLDMGYLLGLGISYAQAKQRGGAPLEVLAATVASASPLASVPHRLQSARLVFLTLLRTFQLS